MTTIMRILYHNAGENSDPWLPRLEADLPEAEIREWKTGDNAPADYALVCKPPRDMLSGRTELKAVFNLAAGVDTLLDIKNVLPKVYGSYDWKTPDAAPISSNPI